MMRTDPPRPARTGRTVAALFAAALLAFVLAACTPPQQFPEGTTDTELWERNDIRIDTEVPNQYPDGTTRGAAEEHGDDEEH